MGSETGIFICPSKKDRGHGRWHSRRSVHDPFLLFVFSVNILFTHGCDGWLAVTFCSSRFFETKIIDETSNDFTLYSLPSKFPSDLTLSALHIFETWFCLHPLSCLVRDRVSSYFYVPIIRYKLRTDPSTSLGNCVPRCRYG